MENIIDFVDYIENTEWKIQKKKYNRRYARKKYKEIIWGSHEKNMKILAPR